MCCYILQPLCAWQDVDGDCRGNELQRPSYSAAPQKNYKKSRKLTLDVMQKLPNVIVGRVACHPIDMIFCIMKECK